MSFKPAATAQHATTWLYSGSLTHYEVLKPPDRSRTNGTVFRSIIVHLSLTFQAEPPLPGRRNQVQLNFWISPEAFQAEPPRCLAPQQCNNCVSMPVSFFEPQPQRRGCNFSRVRGNIGIVSFAMNKFQADGSGISRCHICAYSRRSLWTSFQTSSPSASRSHNAPLSVDPRTWKFQASGLAHHAATLWILTKQTAIVTFQASGTAHLTATPQSGRLYPRRPDFKPAAQHTSPPQLRVLIAFGG